MVTNLQVELGVLPKLWLLSRLQRAASEGGFCGIASLLSSLLSSYSALPRLHPQIFRNFPSWSWYLCMTVRYVPLSCHRLGTKRALAAGKYLYFFSCPLENLSKYAFQPKKVTAKPLVDFFKYKVKLGEGNKTISQRRKAPLQVLYNIFIINIYILKN